MSLKIGMGGSRFKPSGDKKTSVSIVVRLTFPGFLKVSRNAK